MADGTLPLVRGQLRDEFRSEEIVERPDHPLLLRGPDVLVGNEGRMAAIFVPHALEHSNPAHLASRLIASRLALPHETRTILLLDAQEEGRFAALTRDFALTTGPGDRSLSKFIRDARDFGHSAPIDPNLRRYSVKQFDVSYAATEGAFRLARTLRKTGVERRPVSKLRRESIRIENDGLTYQPQNRIRLPEGGASVLTAKSHHNLRRQLVATSSGHLLENFALDNGVPVPRKLIVHVAIADCADQVFGLRSYVIAGAAFAGVSIAPADDVEVAHATFVRLGPFSEGAYG